jgi:hypothetical protein
VTLRSCLYRGRIMHERLRPARHRFTYDVFSLYLDLEELEEVGGRLRLLSIERPSFLSFHAKDHGPRDGSPLLPWLRRLLGEQGIEGADGRVMLLCLPRLLGYVFNPLSVYFCHDRAGGLRAIVYEVKNTFGEQRCYALPVEPGPGPVRQECDKAMYVSPFIGMNARYAMRVIPPGERLSLVIQESEPEGPVLVASHTATRRPLSDRELMKAVAASPLLTFKVIAGIHLEAFRLWRKGVPWYRHRPMAGAARATSRHDGDRACETATPLPPGPSR